MLDKKSLISEENNILEYNIGLINKEINKNTDIINSYERDIIIEERKVDELSYSRILNENIRLKDILKNPYYGRLDIDYVEDNESASIYIGRKSFILDNKAIIVSWAEPIADVYERFNCGKFQYHYKNKKTEKDLYLSGNITDKRKIAITNQCVTDVFSYKEISLSETDEDKLITEKLEKSETDKLGVILETIKRDQNRIIRLPIEKNILVHGCAGSGKSSVAFHRLAYLAYNYNLNSEDMLVISPNKIFQGYTSDILFELGTDFNATQKTFFEFAQEILGINLPNRNIRFDQENAKLNKILTGKKFKSLLDRGVEYTIDNYIPKESIEIDDLQLVLYDEILSIWKKEFATYKLNVRIEKFKEYIEKYLYKKVDDYINTIKQKYENNRKKFLKYNNNYTIYNDVLELSKEEEKTRCTRIRKEALLIISSYIRGLKTVNTFDLYKNLFIEKENINLLCKYIFFENEEKELLNRNIKLFEAIDYIPLTYLSLKINDIDKKYRHIVIDECQDMSYIEIAIIEKLTNSFTLVGDFNQRIDTGKDMISIDEINDMFRKYTYFEVYSLNKSFRNSNSITYFSNEILKPYFINNKYIPQSFNRETCKPKVYFNMNYELTIKEIIKNIKDRSNVKKNIGVIFKETDSVKKYYETIKEEVKDININLIENEYCEYKKGVNLLSARLSKGLEFDYVIIAEGDKYLDNESDRRLLYVSATRALHELDIYIENRNCFITSIDDNLWDGKKKFSTDKLFSDIKDAIINNLEKVYGNLKDEYKDYIYSIQDNTKLLQIPIKLTGLEDIDEFFYNEGVILSENPNSRNENNDILLKNSNTNRNRNNFNTPLISESILNDIESGSPDGEIIIGANCKELIGEINTKVKKLYGKQIDVADYIINNLDKVAKFKTCKDMADAIGVSSSTISLVLLRLNQDNFIKFVSKVRYCIAKDSSELASYK
ncbi:UvrD-helicase domain-containing protein [Clostridium sp. NSJ-145]|uniref:HelD family protein n=1 Tax=Clostridium sp. NSJ-145 TaxID=2897777 RepID=UPI001E4F4482|nr:UvrD-helicase domain-containing protein [Clostridium sp. NSJ-145]MCD2501111.1 UvrD-helicase domain-containing protein [Clostridium sp. NSJ-145]